MKKTCVFLALLGITSPLWSQDALVLTEEKVRELALTASYVVQESEAVAAASRSQALAAASRTKPQIGLQASVSQRSSVPELRLPPNLGGSILYSSIESTAGTALTLSHSFESATRYASRAAQSHAQHAQTEAARTRLDVVLDARLAFWQAVLANSLVAVAEKELQRAEQNLADTKLLEEAGLATRADVLTAQAYQERAWVALLNARSAAALELASLCSLLRLPSHQPVELQASATPPPPPLPLKELLPTALRQRPELAAAWHQSEGFHFQELAAMAAAKPQFSLFAQYDWSRPNPRYLPLENRWHGSWSLGLTATLKLWDGGEAQAKAAAAAAQRTAALAHLEELRRVVSLEVERARQDLDDALAVILAASAALAAAQERERAVRENYLAGLARVEDVLAAESALAQAEFELEKSRIRAWMAQARLERSVGQ
ncbi:MAG: TolC family protein [Thermoanaerobaculum sp.]